MVPQPIGIIGRASAFGLLAPLVAPALSAGAVHQVTMESVTYAPKQLKVRVGDTVEWTNRDIVAHTATAKDRSWDVNVAVGKAGRVVMNTPGSVAYFCRYHPNMTGEIIVEP